MEVVILYVVFEYRRSTYRESKFENTKSRALIGKVNLEIQKMTEKVDTKLTT